MFPVSLAAKDASITSLQEELKEAKEKPIEVRLFTHQQLLNRGHFGLHHTLNCNNILAECSERPDGFTDRNQRNSPDTLPTDTFRDTSGKKQLVSHYNLLTLTLMIVFL